MGKPLSNVFFEVKSQKNALSRILVHLLYFLATCSIVFLLLYLSLSFPEDYLLLSWFYWLNGLFPNRGLDFIVTPLLIALFVASAQFIVTLVMCFRNEILAAGRPSWAELALTVPTVLLAPVYNFALLIPIPVGLVLYDILIRWLNIWPGAELMTSSEYVPHWPSAVILKIAIVEFIILLLISMGAFLVVRSSRVAYGSFFKRTAVIMVYFAMIHSGSALFIGFGGFII